jgi:hypothetical protein
MSVAARKAEPMFAATAEREGLMTGFGAALDAARNILHASARPMGQTHARLR